MRAKLTITLLSFLWISAVAQDRVLSPLQQIEDINEYCEVLKAKHIGLFRFQTKKEFAKYCDSLVKGINDSCTYVEFYRTISRLNASIKCGHTSVAHPDSNWFDKQIFIPHNIYGYQGKYFIRDVFSSEIESLATHQIKSVNGMEIEKLMELLNKHYSSDGNIRSRSKKFLENLFPIYVAKYFDTSAEYKIVTLGKLNELDTFYIKSVTYHDLIKKQSQKKNNINLEQINTSDCLHLKISSFYIQPETFARKIDSVFCIINKSQFRNLIVDLRDNTGGKIANENYLLSYLIKKKRKSHIKRTYINNQGKERPYKMDNIIPHPKAYIGNLFFVMNGYTYSAAAEFMAIAKYYDLGSFVGEETGGTASGCNYGKHKHTLKNSGLKCSIPWHKSEFRKRLSPNGRGVFPDHNIVYSLNDLKQNIDLEIEFILSKLTE